jgi:hypothetical protein
MKKIILISVISLFACSNQQKIVNEEIKKTVVQEKKETVSQKKDTIQKAEVKAVNVISGHAVFANSYCGGAAPSEEMMANSQREQPLTNTTVKLQNIKTKKEYRITTDGKANFSAEIEPGNYDYYMTASYNKKMGATFTSSCEVWLKRCYGQLKVKAGKMKGYKLGFYYGCNPCEPPRP